MKLKLQNPKMQEEIIRNIKSGAPLKACVQAAGVSFLTFLNTKKKIENGDRVDEDLINFYARVKEYQAKTCVSFAKVVEHHKNLKSLDAAKFYLTHRHPEDYCKEPKNDGQQIIVNLVLPDEDPNLESDNLFQENECEENTE